MSRLFKKTLGIKNTQTKNTEIQIKKNVQNATILPQLISKYQKQIIVQNFTIAFRQQKQLKFISIKPEPQTKKKRSKTIFKTPPEQKQKFLQIWPSIFFPTKFQNSYKFEKPLTNPQIQNKNQNESI